MAAGDPQRVWFSEMIERLRAQCHPGMSCEGLIELRNELDAQLQRIRSERHIHSPLLRCPCCGHVGEAADPHVSVRALILSLGRFGIASAAQTRAAEERWAAHRKQPGLISMVRASLLRAPGLASAFTTDISKSGSRAEVYTVFSQARKSGSPTCPVGRRAAD
jgi:hypothetical protein